jgi:hypothetical protein
MPILSVYRIFGLDCCAAKLMILAYGKFRYIQKIPVYLKFLYMVFTERPYSTFNSHKSYDCAALVRLPWLQWLVYFTFVKGFDSHAKRVI